MLHQFPWGLSKTIANNVLVAYTITIFLVIFALVFFIIWLIIRCCTRKSTQIVRAKHADQLDEKNRNFA